MDSNKDEKIGITESKPENGDDAVETKQKYQIISWIREEIQHTSGPLPSPQILKEYNELMPGAADRIFKMAEKAQDHIESTEKKLIDLDIKTELMLTEFEIKKVSTGQTFAFIISITGLIGGIVCAFIGATEIGLALVGGGHHYEERGLQSPGKDVSYSSNEDN
ncbi:MAG: DUF2335 domain-containing protein [bacterium]|nr:DUF2335 domain-containing protein [bacterium]